MMKQISKSYILTLFLLLTTTFGLIAQDKVVKGVVIDEDQQPVYNSIVYLEGKQVATTNSEGKFSFSAENPSKIRNLNVIKRGYKMQTWAFEGAGVIKVLLTFAPVYIDGVVLKDGKPVSGKFVKISGQKFTAVKTNDKGAFQLIVDRNYKVQNSTIFLVDGDPVKKNFTKYNATVNKVTITLPSENGQKEVKVAKKTTSTPKKVQAKPLEDEIYVDPILVVVVYDEDISPADSLNVRINEKNFITDKNGEFEVYADSLSEANFEIDDYSIIKTKYDYEDNYMFVYISDGSEDGGQGVTNMEYSENFQAVFNSLEAEKQLLQENGSNLRKEIQKISEKLDKDINPKNKKSLESYLERLTNSLIENELRYEEAQYKTSQMLDRMRNQISNQETTIVQIEEEKEEVETERMLYFVVAAISLILIFFFYKNSQKLKEQRDDLQEITGRLEKANEEVVKSHEEMLSVKDIGQKFTATLDFDKHMLDLQESVMELVPANTFGIGIYNKFEKRLEFRNQVSDVGLENYYSVSVSDAYSLASWCFNNEVELIINNFDEESPLYIPQGRKMPTRINQSIIYMPLIVETKVLGVITMQAKEIDQYKDINISNLKALASYASIAVANYISYKELSEKNKSITDSMRYAKTIQNAILPSESLLKENFKDHFILYRSKDIVSGDFYWFKRKEVNGTVMKFIAVVDCTGHGVPGAFMSMIGNTLLNDIVNVKGVTDTVEILNALNVGVKESLQQENSMNDDGMDVALIAMKEEADGVHVQFSGAKRPIFVFTQEKQELEVIQGDIKSIGYSSRKNKVFSAHTIVLQKEDIIYLSTDGYVDQNNANREKIGSLKLKDIIASNATKPMAEQEEALEEILDQHLVGEIEQRDDITVMGVKV
ncbi:GAF domain-containing SpoIIE family protein phosphatase [Flammeovirga sp. EKP202]|uniref:GAF domain-containing SpoIIE family protein phosphatase n=1 Tax=Flammeovirga sp. EKP202 TaxID=2770592 RepID=UPI00165FC949|nr:SpoIIE family protein phosphatase [Flammeovirga sp. EKP202]MBD0401208.1 SpoIIE family protein phosphatase [Flammeovirga sp. EKP202]